MNITIPIVKNTERKNFYYINKHFSSREGFVDGIKKGTSIGDN